MVLFNCRHLYLKNTCAFEKEGKKRTEMLVFFFKGKSANIGIPQTVSLSKFSFPIHDSRFFNGGF